MPKPTAAFVLSLIGGIFVIIGGLIGALIGATLTFFIGGVGGIFGVLGIIWGILIIIFAILLYNNPSQRVAYSVLIIIFSVLSWIGAIGGFLIGFVLGLVGGILGLVHGPGESEQIRICLNCGSQIQDRNTSFCPHCGNDLRMQK
ncbi:hypothetical protein HRbin01_00674 [archaeon HR01]|nr:hypothetical protein HRbin01_00674 [archaeon HR01]